jgi:aminoglycoside/choline kinase family phosphotransferase
LKVLGIFARLAHRDGKAHYLRDIPAVLAYATKAAHRYHDLSGLARLLDRLGNVSPTAQFTF